MGKKNKGTGCNNLFHLDPNFYDPVTNAGLTNNMTYFMYLNLFIRIMMNRYRWQNLPNSCNEEILEKALCQNGRAIFFEDKRMTYLTLPYVDSGELNVYGYPLRRVAYSPYTKYNYDCTDENSVIIFNNYMRFTEFNIANNFALRISGVQRTADVNVSGQKKMKGVVCSEDNRLSYKNIMESYDGNVPLVFINKNVDLDDFKTFEFTTDESFLKLDEYKKKLFHEFLTFIGINNTDFEKGERLVTNEVDSNNEIISIMKSDGLEMRQKACEEINQKFGLNVSVEWNPRIKEFAEQLYNQSQNNEKESVENE